MTDHPDYLIDFNCVDVEFELNNPQKIQIWINKCIESFEKQLGEISYYFCSDEYLLQLNQSSLNHDTYTDIITFDSSVLPIVAGEIYISIDRVKENALSFKVSFQEELFRVIIHGVLHLCGLKDKKPEEQILMTKAEEFCLIIFSDL